MGKRLRADDSSSRRAHRTVAKLLVEHASRAASLRSSRRERDGGIPTASRGRLDDKARVTDKHRLAFCSVACAPPRRGVRVAKAAHDDLDIVIGYSEDVDSETTDGLPSQPSCAPTPRHQLFHLRTANARICFFNSRVAPLGSS